MNRLARTVLTFVLSAVVVFFVGCGGLEATPAAPLSVEITSHTDMQHVTGVIMLSGSAVGGSVEVAIDDSPFGPVATLDWSLPLDTDTWVLGWHTVHVRVTNGARQAVTTINIYSEGGVEPPVVFPIPPVVLGPPTDGLVAHWDFESGAQDVSASAIAGLSEGTISIRFRREGIDAGTLLYLGSSANGSDSVSISIAQGRVHFTVLRAGNVALGFDTPNAIEQDRWHTYTVSIGPGGHKTYLDGTEVARRYSNGTNENTHAFFRSINDPDILTLGDGFNGRLSDVRVYDRVLSAAEVTLVTAFASSEGTAADA